MLKKSFYVVVNHFSNTWCLTKMAKAHMISITITSFLCLMYSCFILMIATKNSTVFVALIIKYISLVDYKVLQSESSHYEQSKQNM